MKAIRKAHEVECIQYKNPQEVVKLISDYLEVDVKYTVHPGYIFVYSSFFPSFDIDNGNWFVLPNQVLTDKEFKEQYDTE